MISVVKMFEKMERKLGGRQFGEGSCCLLIPELRVRWRICKTSRIYPTNIVACAFHPMLSARVFICWRIGNASIRNPLPDDSTQHSLHQTPSEFTSTMADACEQRLTISRKQWCDLHVSSFTNSSKLLNLVSIP